MSGQLKLDGTLLQLHDGDDVLDLAVAATPEAGVLIGNALTAVEGLGGDPQAVVDALAAFTFATLYKTPETADLARAHLLKVVGTRFRPPARVHSLIDQLKEGKI